MSGDRGGGVTWTASELAVLRQSIRENGLDNWTLGDWSELEPVAVAALPTFRTCTSSICRTSSSSSSSNNNNRGTRHATTTTTMTTTTAATTTTSTTTTPMKLLPQPQPQQPPRAAAGPHRRASIAMPPGGLHTTKMEAAAPQAPPPPRKAGRQGKESSPLLPAAPPAGTSTCTKTTRAGTGYTGGDLTLGSRTCNRACRGGNRRALALVVTGMVEVPVVGSGV
ncbi:unnamed protein product, partial [Pylaiella littoralis]